MLTIDTWKWTTEYFDITHFVPSDSFNLRAHWASVEKHGENFYSCTLFQPVGGSKPRSYQFSTQKEARALGEKFVAKSVNEA